MMWYDGFIIHINATTKNKCSWYQGMLHVVVSALHLVMWCDTLLPHRPSCCSTSLSTSPFFSLPSLFSLHTPLPPVLVAVMCHYLADQWLGWTQTSVKQVSATHHYIVQHTPYNTQYPSIRPHACTCRQVRHDTQMEKGERGEYW